MASKIKKTDIEWQQSLTPEQYEICRKKGTERAFTGKYHDCFENGVYHCVCCGNPLFKSEDKFDAGCGWPSFTQPIQNEALERHADQSHGMQRVEVVCEQCNAHLGHVFPDGPQPTGMRFCINSVALKLEKK